MVSRIDPARKYISSSDASSPIHLVVGPGIGSADIVPSAPLKLKISGRTTSLAPAVEALRTHNSASLRFAPLSEEGSICTAAARNFISCGGSYELRLSSFEKDRARTVSQHILRGAAQNQLDDATMAIGAYEEEVVSKITQVFHDPLLRKALGNLITHI